MPPCTWMLSSELRTYAGKAEAAAAAASSRNCRESSSARAASHTSAVAVSAATVMLAQWCLMAWNVAMVRPNCSRTLAYSTAVSTQSVAPPTASAANSARA